MKSQKNNSLREGQFPQKQRKAALVCLSRRGGIIGHMQQLLPLQKHPFVFTSTATLDDNVCGTKGNGQKYKYLPSLPDVHSFVYCKYIYSKGNKKCSFLKCRLTFSAKNKPSGVFPSGRWRRD